eukprot:TRINITY_DN8367_c0_g1_i1.p1 TRINITY_DN8367_c0_g1~~TRINITY_DN8367_c0_g1_i1.p1  ORF type:complete len:218 (-),score=60.47 TRINITY_DN8367_c0_g1_i1:24-677(-)
MEIPASATPPPQPPSTTNEVQNKLEEAFQQNLRSALVVSIYLLPSTFTELQLYTQIVHLSYMGDIRMNVRGENPKKVENIVGGIGNISIFRKLYLPYLQQVIESGYLLTQSDGADLIFRKTQKTKDLCEWLQFPSNLSNFVDYHQKQQQQQQQQQQTLQNLEEEEEKLKSLIQLFLIRTNRLSSFKQTAKGILTAGPLNSFFYALHTFKKGLNLNKD